MELESHSKSIEQQSEPEKSRTTTKHEPSVAVPVSNAIVRALGPSSPAVVRYRECLKNHAANMGGHFVDGCGEFMPYGEEGTPKAMICAACECHRNFHRKEVEGEPPNVLSPYYKSNGHVPALPHQQRPILHHYRYHPGVSAAPVASVMMNFGGGVATGAESSSGDLNVIHAHMQGQVAASRGSSKKRFRTKFSEEQKERMMEFAEKIGWGMQKNNEQEVQQFCSELGLKRKVFKVWIHNNKQAMKRKQQPS